MVLSVNDLKEFLYCPKKAYFNSFLDESSDRDVDINNSIKLKNLRVDIHGLIIRNIRNLKKTMKLEEIEETLHMDIDVYIKETVENIQLKSEEELDELFDKYFKEFHFKTKLLSLHAMNLMGYYGKDGLGIVEIIYPTLVYNYYIIDKSLDISGKIDRIEIIDGSYYPISIKENKPPLKGVWDNEAIEIAAYAQLIQKEFDVDVYVGFIEYVKLDIKRPVSITPELKRGLYMVLDQIREMKSNTDPPNVNMDIKKCMKCEYYYICNDSK